MRWLPPGEILYKIIKLGEVVEGGGLEAGSCFGWSGKPGRTRQFELRLGEASVADRTREGENSWR